MTSEKKIRRTLRRLERLFRKFVLALLSEWSTAEMVRIELLPSLASFARPSWGTWNGLLSAIRAARRAVIRSGTADERERIEGLIWLTEGLSRIEGLVEADSERSYRRLCGLLQLQSQTKVRCIDVVILAISLRNSIEHGRAPEPDSDPNWWEACSTDLEQIASSSAVLASLEVDDTRIKEPLFIREQSELWVFSSIQDDGMVLYSPEAGATQALSDHSPSLLNLVSRLLGVDQTQEKDLRRLVRRLAPDELKGVLLGDYLVGPPCGQGGFAKVHAARQLCTNRKVAVKLLNDGLSSEDRQRFQQEAEFLSRFNHPRIVHVIEYGEETWHPSRQHHLDDEAWYLEFARGAPLKTFIALEWLDGPTLEDVYGKPSSVYSDRQITQWFLDAADALSAVHSAQLIHRDIKPSNLMLDRDRALKLMDFGVARSQQELRTLQTATGHQFGTPAYMSPEQLRAIDADSDVGPATDIYSLCATFYELFTRERCYAHDRKSAEEVRNSKLTGKRPEYPRRLQRSIPWEMEIILLGGLEPEPADRYSSIDALRRDLQNFLSDQPILYRRPGFLRRMRLAYRRNRVIANLVGLFLIIAVMGTAQYVRAIRAEQQQTLLQRNESATRLDRQYVSQGARLLDSG